MSMLRLSSLDRPPIGLSKRLSLLPTNGVSPTRDDPPSSSSSIRTLPSVRPLNNDDFLNMFGDVQECLPVHTMRSHEATGHRGLPSELSATSTTRRFPEPPRPDTQRFDLAHHTMSSSQAQQIEGVEGLQSPTGQVTCRSSVSSSVPSTRKSNASSRLSKRSSISSMAEDSSSSEGSAKDLEKDTALHERLKSRSREKRSCLGEDTPITAQNTSQSRHSSRFEPSARVIEPLSGVDILRNQDASRRPISRGKRLGRAMADGVSLGPVTASQTRDRPSNSPVQLRKQSSTVPPKPTVRLSRVLSFPPIEDVDRIRVGIMSQLDNLDDLLACARVSRDFYQTFNTYETLLVDCVLFNQSAAAWELRYSVRHLEKPSPFRVKSVLRDYATVQALEDFIAWKCQSILRPQSLAALLGQDPQRKADLEDAIWMVWSFCNAFGKTSMSDATLLKQTQWLNVGSHHLSQNHEVSQVTRGACTMRHLEDMSEVWRCLESILSGFKGREAEARLAGVFDNAQKSKMTDKELLTAWMQDILSLGPKAALTLSSCDFEQARVLGITKWSPPSKGKSRANFLRSAVEEVYRERLMKEARQKALSYRKSVNAKHQHQRSASDPASLAVHSTTTPNSPKGVTQWNELDSRKRLHLSMPVPSLSIARAAVEIRPDCDPLSPLNASAITSVDSNAAAFSPLFMAKKSSTRLGPTLFPMQNRDQSQRLSIASTPQSRSHAHLDQTQASDQVTIDPTDKAVALMVCEMGFSEVDAKRALALSDTGAGIDIETAIDILSSNTSVDLSERMKRKSQLCELPALTGNAKLAPIYETTNGEVCGGHCQPKLLAEPRRERVSGLGMVKRRLSSRMSFKRNSNLSVIQDVEEGYNSPPKSRNLDVAHTTLPVRSTSAFTTPFLIPAVSSSTDTRKAILTTPEEITPISPIDVDGHKNWSNGDIRTDRTHCGNNNSLLSPPAKPRIALQRVGTGGKKTAWSISSMRRKHYVTEPEVIGYSY